MQSLAAFGNPAVWWSGLVATLFAAGCLALRKIKQRDDASLLTYLMICLGGALLPWVFITRATFIYHYFASVPFIILATAQGLRYLERHNKKLSHALMLVLGVAAVALFIAFFPYASGVTASTKWLSAMQWFKGWLYY